MINNRKCYLLTVIIFLFVGIGQISLAQEIPQNQTGPASWYGSKYHGRTTSSGERYNKNDMTAAHKTLPFGTKVKVTNLSNNESVVLRINDRGPFVGKRIIDVSEVAARKLGMHQKGIAKVKVEIVEYKGKTIAAAEPATYSIEKGTYTSKELALQQTQKLKAFDESIDVEVTEADEQGAKVHRLKIGKFADKKEAEAFNDLLREEGPHGEVRES